MPAQVSFFDIAINLTPPTGHLEPALLTLGANWQQNDIRTLLVAGLANSDNGTAPIPMAPDPPTGFPAVYNLAPSPGFSTQGVYCRRLVNGDSGTSVAWPKPPGWNNYLFVTLTARGCDPGATPAAGQLPWSHAKGASTLVVGPATVPGAGTMVFLLNTVPDVDSGGWPVSMGLPAGWAQLAATDKSGANFYAYGVDPSVMVIGKSYSSAGSTGTVTVPCGVGAPAFVGMYAFFQSAPDVSVAVGAA